MKRTGRTLSLTNDVVSLTPIDSIANLGYRLTTIFEDDREGYAWKITRIEMFPNVTTAVRGGWTLFTTRPDNFDTAADFGVWALGKAFASNQMIGTAYIDNFNGVNFRSLKDNHMAVNHLSLLYDDSPGNLPTYNITLEEYEITDREEIAYKIKEISQSLNPVGE